jgi:hypothetical protein
MSFWDVDICNDPNNDYDLIYELLFLGYGFANIEQTKNGLILILFDHSSLSLPVPFDWLLKTMLDAQKDLPASKIKNIKKKKLNLKFLDGKDSMFLLYKGKNNFADITQTGKGLFLILWRKKTRIFINFDWLLNVMKRAKKELPSGKIENMDE